MISVYSVCVKCNLFQTIHSLLFISHRNTLGTVLLGSVGTITITALEQRQTVGAIADIPFAQRQSVSAIDTTIDPLEKLYRNQTYKLIDAVKPLMFLANRIGRKKKSRKDTLAVRAAL